MAAARVIGAAPRLATSGEVSRDGAVAELHAITSDPVPLGYALGVFLHRVEVGLTSNQPVVDLLRAAGADEDIAAMKLAWVRWRADVESQSRPPRCGRACPSGHR